MGILKISSAKRRAVISSVCAHCFPFFTSFFFHSTQFSFLLWISVFLCSLFGKWMLNVPELYLNAISPLKEGRQRRKKKYWRKMCALSTNTCSTRTESTKNPFKCKFNNYLNIFAMNLQLQQARPKASARCVRRSFGRIHSCFLVFRLSLSLSVGLCFA